MLVAHLSDTHLGIRLYGLEWTYETILEHFAEAVERALGEGVDAIIIAGDMFDRPRPPNNALKSAMEAVARALEKGVRVYSVLGEHDLPKVADIPPQLLIPGLRVLGVSGLFSDCFTVDGAEYCIGGASHRPLKYGRGVKQKLLALLGSVANRLTRRSVLVLHQNIVNFNMFEPGLEIGEIPDKPMYVAMGHLHRRVKFRRENGQVIAYSGSLDILRRDEIEEWKSEGKGFYLVDLSGDEPSVTEVNTEVIPQEHVKTSLEDLEDNVIKALGKLPRNKKSILHVTVTLRPSEKVDVLVTLRRIVSMYSPNTSIRLEKRYIEESEGGEDTVLEGIDEVEVIAEILGGRKYRDLAEKIYLLKQALVRGEDEVAKKLVDEIANHSYWIERRSKEIEQLLIKLPDQPSAHQQQ
jgi:DNA repair exonuclease SbcCD nuclease subunit